MSLLLDALKKSGSASPDKSSADNLSELTLEEIPGKPATPATTPLTESASLSTPRHTGENLFAAKKPAPVRKFRYNLGIVPTAIILGLILATVGSIYVWYEIQPPKAAQYRPSAASNAPAAPLRPMPALALAPEPAQHAESRASVRQTAAAPENPVKVRPDRNRQLGQTAAAAPAKGIQFERRTDEDDTYSILLSGYQAYQNGDLGTAWQRYREVLIRDAKNRDALLGMAAIAQQQGQDETAIQYYRKVLSLDPRDPVALAGMSAYSTADATGRESRLKLNLNQSPNSAALYFALGKLYTEQSRWSEAQAAYFNALRIEPDNALFAFRLASSLDHMGQGKIAAQYYQQSLQLDPKGTAGFDRAQTEKRLNQLLAP